ncbi:TauD/TfdA family dioxygenase [Dactylosporangium sp. CA-139114]|uniref:TauD/TfdA family dioxygenase n=1 Tax=Dactylosporangium sp. CA-139114 TaxID=3239931 RepID=UPI003D97611F
MSVLAAPGDVFPPSAARAVDLTEDERSAVGSAADELTRSSSGLLDDPDWLGHARHLSCRLPYRLLAALRHFRHDAGPHGTLRIGNLPIDAARLRDTPSARDSVERDATGPAAVAMLLGQALGEVMAFRDEKAGALVQNVVPVRTLAASQSNAGSVPLELHTENAFHPHRPDYVGLLCLRGDRDGRAATLLSCVRRALPHLDAAAIAVLSSPRFVTQAPPSFRAGAATAPHPVLGGGSDPELRVDFHATAALDGEARSALDLLGAALLKAGTSPVLRPGEMMFLDNRLVVHGRSTFTPRYDGRDRWLHRIYVHLDSRRGIGHRIGPGPVLA